MAPGGESQPPWGAQASKNEPKAPHWALDMRPPQAHRARVPAQRGGRRGFVPRPPSALHTSRDIEGWSEHALDDLRRERELDLWIECVDAALAPLRLELEAAWTHAAELYRERSEHPSE